MAVGWGEVCEQEGGGWRGAAWAPVSEGEQPSRTGPLRERGGCQPLARRSEADLSLPVGMSWRCPNRSP